MSEPANCEPNEDGICVICGAAVRPGTKRNCHARRPPPRVPLGDWVAAGLAAVGITPERVEAFTGKPCGCKERQEALNRLF